MSLRLSPLLIPAALAVHRPKALKSIGTRTAAGKREVSRDRTRLQQSEAPLMGLTEAPLLGQEPAAPRISTAS